MLPPLRKGENTGEPTANKVPCLSIRPWAAVPPSQTISAPARRSNCKRPSARAHLPTFEEKPFTVLLASCFCKREDDEGAVGRTYAQLPAGSRPDVKILCGDQVYLDDPWAH